MPPVPLTLLAVAGRAVRGRAGALSLAAHRQLLAGQARLLLQLALWGGSGASVAGGGRGTRHSVPLPAVGCHHPYRRAVGVAVGAADGGERGGVAGLAAPVALGARRLDPAWGERRGGTVLSPRFGPPAAGSAPALPPSYLCSSFLRLMHMARW